MSNAQRRARVISTANGLPLTIEEAIHAHTHIIAMLNINNAFDDRCSRLQFQYARSA